MGGKVVKIQWLVAQVCDWNDFYFQSSLLYMMNSQLPVRFIRNHQKYVIISTLIVESTPPMDSTVMSTISSLYLVGMG